jgi:hypothetical protein
MSSHFQGVPYLKCITCNNPNLYLHNGQCVSSCPVGYIANSNNYCYCSGSGTLTVNEKCLNVTACPITMGWDPSSFSCLSCSFGCISCYNSACTACSPGYFLYVSPQAVRCRRKSPLFACNQQFGWVNDICLVLNYSNPALGLTKCLPSSPNCIACYPFRSDMCTACASGFVLYNNTCLNACPAGTLPYSTTCLLPEIVNCPYPYLRLKSQPFVLNYDKIQNSAPYSYYTFQGK